MEAYPKLSCHSSHEAVNKIDFLIGENLWSLTGFRPQDT